MSQAAQAQGLHDQGVQLFEEARRGLSDALGRMSEANEKLKSGELTSEAATTWREKFDTAYEDAARLKKQAAQLSTLNEGIEVFDSDSPRYLHPNDVGAQEPAPGSADPQQSLGSGLTHQVGARDGDAPEWRPHAGSGIRLGARARTLLNALVRGEGYGGRKFHRLSQQDQDFLTADRGEHLMSPYVSRDGGFITAEEVRTEVIGHLRDALYIRQRARNIQTDQASIAFPTAKISTTLKKKRAGRGTGSDPISLRDIFGKSRFTPDGHGEIVKVPEQLLQDSTFDVVGFLSEQIAMNDQESEEEFFLTGSGNGEPLGILTALERLAAKGFTGLSIDHSGSGADFTANDLKTLPYKLKKIYRVGGASRGAAWTSNRAWIEKVSVMRTEAGGAGTNTGDFLFRQGTSAGDPDLVSGFAFLESEFFPNNIDSGSDGDPLCLFGNWMHYWIVDRASLNIRVLPELYSETDEVGYKYEKRFDGAPVRADAFVFMAHN